MSDFAKRDLGSRSLLALEGLEGAIWLRSVETLRAAEALYARGELTAEKAQGVLIALLEQKRLRDQLETQIEEGTRAATRIASREAGVAILVEKGAQEARHGRNRFFARSRVPAPRTDAL